MAVDQHIHGMCRLLSKTCASRNALRRAAASFARHVQPQLQADFEGMSP
jgi:hypothetical protein